MRLFITGTDTNIGKTYVSCNLLTVLKNAGLSTIGIKPVSSGCQMTAQGLRNEDALLLQKHASLDLPYSLVNPLAFEPPVAPFIPAEMNQIKLTCQSIVGHTQAALNIPADVHLIEGVGGWFMPLSNTETMADVAIQLEAEIIMVVGMRLGCLNHALLTYEAICQKTNKLIAWVANCIDPEMPYIDKNIALLQARIDVPLLSVINYGGEMRLFEEEIYRIFATHKLEL